MTTYSRPPTLRGLALTLALAASGVPLAACSSPEETRTEDVYCADGDGRVLPESYCDDDDRNGGGGFIFIGGYGGGYRPGQILPADRTTTGRIPYNDPGARERAGLPARGKVTGPGGFGKVTRTGSFGKSSGGKGGTFSKGGGFGGGGAKGGS